ncbi:InlB B-repeat-containing protein [Traorella massiliensis]|uniref:InlB B-repeat-containing protein n=1 Tax=Traorella massiliensis TaxID=1903263 RepID=UPI00248E9DDE|nr:InlB B-repeat-containing protein [Traorella massiliensis]
MKKLFGILTSVTMILSLMIMPVNAVDGVANVATRTELTDALNDDSITEINLTANIDLKDEEWVGVQISAGRTLTINGNGHTILNMKSYKAAMGPNGSGIAGDGGSCDYYNGWIANNLGTLTINNLKFSNALVDTNPLTTAKNSTGFSILAVVVANNTGKLVYNNVDVDSSTVRGYTKVGVLHGFTQGNGTFTANQCSVTNSEVVLEADGTDSEAAFSGVIAGYDGNGLISTYGIKLAGNKSVIHESVNWGEEVVYDSETGVASVEKDGHTYGLTCNTYTTNSYGNAAVVFAADINGYGYESLQDAINAADPGETIKLLRDVNEDVVVSAGLTLTLDLNGNTLTNVTSDTITVEKGATLKVIGEGTVDNKSNGRAAVFNNGNVTLNGGTYDRTSESGESADISGGNSWYTICNHGTMTINKGVTVKNTGSFSSMIENGYYSYNSSNTRNGHDPSVNEANPSLKINGGEFVGGLNTVKNDDGGVLTIKDGNFTNTTQAAVLNWNKATIEGGYFETDAENCILNGASSMNSSKNNLGELTISGGTFNSNGITVLNYFTFTGDELINIKGGTYLSDGVADNSVTQYFPENSNLQVNPDTGEVGVFHTVTFVIDNEEKDVLVKENGLAEALEAPVKEGYTFVGWFNGDKEYDFSTPVTSDLELTAKFEKNNVPVDPEKPVDDNTTETPQTPNTGDTSMYFYYGLMLIACAGIFFARKKASVK